MQFVIAHQGGWDEILYIVIPVLAAIGAVRWAEARRGRQDGGGAEQGEADEPPASGGANGS